MINHQLLKRKYSVPNKDTRILVLGTFNPECGQKVDYYYGRCGNNFWRAIEKAANLKPFTLQNDLQSKLRLLKKYKFACLDVIKSIKPTSKAKEEHICGKGYTDSHLFNKKVGKCHFQFEEIINTIFKYKIQKIIYTWGKLKGNREFREGVEDITCICNLLDIEFVVDCPNPSGYHKGAKNLITLTDFYAKEIIKYKTSP